MKYPSPIVLSLTLIAACGEGDDAGMPLLLDPDFGCSIPVAQLQDGGQGKDGIPSLDNPPLTDPSDSTALWFLRNTDRVVGIVVGDRAVAVPHNILWYHEIVNLDLDGELLAITHCPLTGSSLVFDRAAIGGGTFGVSGLLFRNNQVMFDRTTQESLWPQMVVGARCGPRDGQTLELYPFIEMTWEGWRLLHPETKVVGETGLNRPYTLYPYGDYDVPTNSATLHPMPAPLDARRPPKERVLGVPGNGGSDGIAIPYGALDAQGVRTAVHVSVNGQNIVVFWDGRRQAAAAYLASTSDGELKFTASGGFLNDTETSSIWSLAGIATSGPLTGTRLTPVDDAFVAFWFAWASFYPESRLWEESP